MAQFGQLLYSVKCLDLDIQFIFGKCTKKNNNHIKTKEQMSGVHSGIYQLVYTE